ncbi:unnamed protein product [Didymodactylos carnosus]|uniref:Uncharacterized protein n=1 Tax=Didymodactylos carnosus TaxID=1234261 RepID=A0A815ZTF5_9BILA|nr:unnamed protein product [Didymodactylos carnosus]CAF4456446.1 unnamed protein product [Didymodactylos carnosus]
MYWLRSTVRTRHPTSISGYISARRSEIRIDCGKTPRKKRQPGADGFCDECLSSVLDSKVQLSMTTLTASQHPTMISTDTKDNDTIGYYPDTCNVS